MREMPGNRIRIDKDAADLVLRLIDSNETTGPFQTYADVLAFAAAFGAKHKVRIPLQQIAKEPAPIGLEIFISRGYDWFIKLLAITETEDMKILSSVDVDSEEKRIAIFEEYANGGLQKLRTELRGSVDYSEHLLLIIAQERVKIPDPNQEFDLTRFLV